MERPGQGLQLDIKYVPYRVRGEKTYVFNAIDDCTRWRFAYLYRNLGYDSAVDFAKRLVKAAPFTIEAIQTDNDIAFTDRFLAKSPDYDLAHPFPELLGTLEIMYKLIPPGIKELNGKVERSHKTDDHEFFWKQPNNITFDQLQEQLAIWISDYNKYRPHISLGMKTPAQRLADFPWQPKNSKRLLKKLEEKQRTNPPIALQLANKLKKLGKDDSWFKNQLPKKKKRRRSLLEIAMIQAELSKPLPPLCKECRNTTLIYWLLKGKVVNAKHHLASDMACLH